MDDESGSPRLADPVITVEPGGPAADGHIRSTAPVPVPQLDLPCPHRVRFRDLRPAGRFLYASSLAAFAVNSLAQGAAVLIALAHDSGLVVFSLLVSGSIFTAVGTRALRRTWARLHRPTLTALWTDGIGILCWAVGSVLLSYQTDQYWAVLLVVVALPVPWLLMVLYGLLYDRSTCRSHPGFPPRFAELLVHPYPVSAAPAAGPAHPGWAAPPAQSAWAAAAPQAPYRREDCPHFVPFADLRTRYRATSALDPVLTFVYFAGIGAFLVDVYGATAELFTTEDAIYNTAAFAVLLLPLNFVGLREISRRSKRLHRPSAAVFTLSLLGYLITALLCGSAALGGMAVAWPAAIIALYRTVGLIIAMAELPRRAACRGLPPVTPAMARRRRAEPSAQQAE
jgi:hypothetical protein